MPYSSSSGKTWSKRIINRLIKKCSYNSILDVGAGAGNYYTMLQPQLHSTKFDGLEIWEPYIKKFELNKKYDNVIVADVRQFTPKQTYGIAILGDVLEHMTKEESIEVYNKILEYSEFIMIVIPIVHYPQDEYMGNPYEKHIKEDWSHDEVLSSFDCIALSYIENEIGVYVGCNPKLHSKNEILNENKPRYAVYGIYKNEEKYMESFLSSVLYADEIVLCDTGSIDDTNKVIESFKKKKPKINIKTFKIHVSPWRFDDARNAAMSLIGKDIDVCISLDMDEYLMDNWKEVLTNRWDIKFTRYYHRFKTFWSNNTFSAHWHDRIHTRNGYAWKLPVHEILEYKAEENICWINDWWIYHKPDDKKSRASYLPMIEQSVKERPDVWKTWSFLAGEYLAACKYEEASNALDKAFSLQDSDKAYLYKTKYHMYKNQYKTDLALLQLNNYILCRPDRREPYFEKAKYLHQLGRNKEAYFALKDAQSRVNEITDYHYNPYSWGEDFSKFMSEIEKLAKME